MKRKEKYRIQPYIDGKRVSFTFDHEPTLQEIEDRIQKYVPVTESYHVKNKPLDYYITEYIGLKTNILSASTIRSYKAIQRALPAWLKNKILNKITKLDIQKYINDISAEKSPKTVRNYYALISSVFATFEPSVDISVTLPQKTKNRQYIPTSEDIQKVLEIADGTEYYIPLVLGCYGLRRSEVFALNLDDFDFDRHIVHVCKAKVLDDDKNWVIKKPKTTESDRYVPLDPDLCERIKSQGHICDRYPDKLLENLKRFQKKAGVRHFTFHSLRHFFATELHQSGFSPKDIMYAGGWASPAIMDSVYTHERLSYSNEKNSLLSAKISSKIAPKMAPNPILSEKSSLKPSQKAGSRLMPAAGLEHGNTEIICDWQAPTLVEDD